jgi:hypothetical protein
MTDTTAIANAIDDEQIKQALISLGWTPPMKDWLIVRVGDSVQIHPPVGMVTTHHNINSRVYMLADAILRARGE